MVFVTAYVLRLQFQSICDFKNTDVAMEPVLGDPGETVDGRLQASDPLPEDPGEFVEGQLQASAQTPEDTSTNQRRLDDWIQ